MAKMTEIQRMVRELDRLAAIMQRTQFTQRDLRKRLADRDTSEEYVRRIKVSECEVKTHTRKSHVRIIRNSRRPV